MPAIHICSLKLVEELSATIKPSHILSVLGGISPFPPTPSGIDPKNHLKLIVSDIIAAESGMIAPAPDHVDEIIAFGRRWAAENDGKRPLLVHCFAGISRSTASALSIACAVHPHVDEEHYARSLRDASRSAQPNSLMIEHADAALGRNGRLIDAVEAIGPGDFTHAGPAFVLKLQV